MRRVLVLLLCGCGPVTPSGARDGGADLAPAGVDPNADLDEDGYSPARGDCNDHNPDIHPEAIDVCDFVDDDCSGHADEECDNDQDGYTYKQGDCDDGDPLVNPGAMEVIGNSVDDNCDHQADERAPACDAVLAPVGNTGALAGAVELCAPWLVSAEVSAASDMRARAVLRDFGVYRPHAGRNFAVLSTGIAADANDPGFVLPQPGTPFTNDAPNPAPQNPNPNSCYNGPDEATVHDYIEWTLTLKVPTNARSFSFDFMFVTAEYPEFVCSQYNDKFLALLDSKAYRGNISFDAKGQPVTVNIGFFEVCQSTMNNACAKPIGKLMGTGYERYDYMNRPIGGGTDWLTTTSPVVPGETITLRFILFDEGDHKFDSTVVIDNFQFQLDAAMAPNTVG